MYCARCGTQIQEGQKFCSGCGQPSAGTAPTAWTMPAPGSVAALPGASFGAAGTLGVITESRLSRHLRVLGIVWIAFSVLRLVPGIALLTGIAALHFGDFDFPFLPANARLFLVPILGAVGVLFTVTAVLGIAAGWGLLERRSWARMLAIVLGCIKLIEVPFGTALGIYTLWVLAPAGAEGEYRRSAQVR